MDVSFIDLNNVSSVLPIPMMTQTQNHHDEKNYDSYVVKEKDA